MSRFERKSKMRPSKLRELIVCEGQKTEPIYFDGLKREQAVRDRYTVHIQAANGGSAFDVVHFAVKKLKEAAQAGDSYNQVWCVLDIESVEKKSTRRIEAAMALADENGICLIWSNPCFERWYLSHFERTCAPINDCNEVIIRLNKHWRKLVARDYDKSATDVFSLLQPKTKVAISCAEFALKEHSKNGRTILDANSATEVHKLVEHLLG